MLMFSTLTVLAIMDMCVSDLYDGGKSVLKVFRGVWRQVSCG
jgi:hypothetical protein